MYSVESNLISTGVEYSAGNEFETRDDDRIVLAKNSIKTFEMIRL